jgi:hypothetical protein
VPVLSCALLSPVSAETLDSYTTGLGLHLQKRKITFASLDNGCKACVKARQILGPDCPHWVVPLMHIKGHVLVSLSKHHTESVILLLRPVLRAERIHAVC